MLTNDLIEAQRVYEEATLTVGRERYIEHQEAVERREGLDRTDAATKHIRGGVLLVSNGMKAWLETTRAAKGRKPVGFKALDMVDPDKIALIGLSAVFRQLGEGGAVTDIVTKIGRSIQIELEASALAEKEPKAASRFLALAEGNDKEGALERRHARMVADADVDLGWSRTTQVLVGNAVLGVLLVAMEGVFEQVEGTDKRGTTRVVQLTKEGAQSMADMREAASWTRPPLQPMVCKPRTWTGLGTGAYFDHRLTKLVPLVRVRSGEHRKLLKAAIADGSMQEVLDAVNAIQDTRWAIDRRVLDMVNWVRKTGRQTAKSFPLAKAPQVPEKLSAEEWDATDAAKRQALSRKRRAAIAITRTLAVDAATFQLDVDTADFLADFEAFYLPHSLDFRGRVYAVPHFNHQRSDHMKALFRFADSVPLGASGGDWLMIHLANCGDFEKVSKGTFEERIAWVRANEGAILEAGTYPEETYDFWGKADSPFCFLQACFEYTEWMRSGYSPDFASSIPIAADGSCSGLQHYSALTRSEGEAMHVNLLPREDVGDIYKITAGAAVPALEAFANSTSDKAYLARIVLDQGFGRSEVKRNVMTYFYGSGKFGMRDQHMEDTMRPLADEVALGKITAHPYAVLTKRTSKDTGEETEALDGGYSCAQVMAAFTHDAVVTVAPKADEAATWIQAVAATLAHESQSMVWRTPTGMPVVQRYSEYTSKAVNLWLYNRKVKVPSGNDRTDAAGNVLERLQLLIREAPTKRVEKKRMRSAASPNVIHSMDGAHLQRSVAMGKAAGIEHFAMIHDSFGTHAGNMALFSSVIREAFIATYADYCPLVELDTYARSVLSDEGIEKLPPIPAKGNLDLNLIRESLYAFA